MDIYTIIEVVSVVLSLGFLILLIKEVKWCWPFGIVSSGLSIFLFIHAKLYSEAILYAFYVVIGVYGWWVWTRPSNDNASPEIPIVRISVVRSGLFFLGAGILAFALGNIFQRLTDAAHPFVDATTTSFSFLASFLEAHKALSAWVYWIVINGVSIWLYFDRGLPIYSMLMVVYFVVSIYGYFNWKKKLAPSHA